MTKVHLIIIRAYWRTLPKSREFVRYGQQSSNFSIFGQLLTSRKEVLLSTSFINLRTVSSTLGQILRGYRESKGLLLRQVAAALQMDTALLSKFERDERKPNKELIMIIAKFYKVTSDEMLLAWLSDKIAEEVQNEDLAKEALKAAEQKIELFKKKKK